MESDIYFAHPYASWERGINENTNGLIRQYSRKDTNFNGVTDDEVQFVMDRLNSQPKATRNFKSMNEMFSKATRNFKSMNEMLWGKRETIAA